jgi:hypothetical protein
MARAATPKKKNPHAVALGRLGGLASQRLEHMTPEERARFHSAGGRAGAKARVQKLSPERRKAIARKAIAARWAKAKRTKKKASQ